jgi:hypothetical protein
MKRGSGPCLFLNDRRCQIYRDRPHYCRQFPFHVYVGEKVQVELDLSCRGVWTGGGEDAKSWGLQMVRDNLPQLKRVLSQSQGIYRQFYSNCQEAGIYRPPDMLRSNMDANLEKMTELCYLSAVLHRSSEEEEMTLPEEGDRDADREEIRKAAMECSLDSLSSRNPLESPIYCDGKGRWNVFFARGKRIEWKVMEDDGSLRNVQSIDAGQVKLQLPQGKGKEIYLRYLRTLNDRDSMIGHTFYLVDEYGYEDHLSNVYYGSMAIAALDLLWRASLLAHISGGQMDGEAVREGIIFYDMDRLDAPTIGAFA